jgi:TetR/AcrR family transcriptional regulator
VSPRDPKSGALAIVDAAMDLFAQERFEAVSVAQIATAAGVCKANVFHHFESKEALYLAVIRRISTPMAEYAEALLAEDGSSAEKIRRLLTFELHYMQADATRTRLILRECMDGGHPKAGELAKQAFQRNFNGITALFEQGQRSGEFSGDFDPVCAALNYVALKMFFFQQQGLMASRPELAHLQSIETFSDQACAIVLGGVASRAAKTGRDAKGSRRISGKE